jgi:signal peptidase II
MLCFPSSDYPTFQLPSSHLPDFRLPIFPSPRLSNSDFPTPDFPSSGLAVFPTFRTSRLPVFPTSPKYPYICPPKKAAAYMSTKRKILLFCLGSIALIALDRYTKILAKQYLMDKEPLSYLHDTIRLGYAKNTGAFLSFGADWPDNVSFWVFGVLPFLLLVAFFVYCIIKAKTMRLGQLVPLGLIFTGGMGNIADRLIYNRQVTDFMNVGIGSLRTGIFNVADMCVTTGVIILLFQSFKKDKKNKEAGQPA